MNSQACQSEMGVPVGQEAHEVLADFHLVLPKIKRKEQKVELAYYKRHLQLNSKWCTTLLLHDNRHQQYLLYLLWVQNSQEFQENQEVQLDPVTKADFVLFAHKTHECKHTRKIKNTIILFFQFCLVKNKPFPQNTQAGIIKKNVLDPGPFYNRVLWNALLTAFPSSPGSPYKGEERILVLFRYDQCIMQSQGQKHNVPLCLQWCIS